MVIKVMTGLLEVPCGSIWIVHDKIIGRVTVECDSVFSLHPGQGKNVGNSVGMKPHGTVPWKVTD